MRSKAVAAAVFGLVAIGGGVGDLAGATGSPQPAAAQTQAITASSMAADGGAMMGAAVMWQMMDAQHAQMMRGPAMRRLRETMVREHRAILHAPGMRRLHLQAIEGLPAMGVMMRTDMDSSPRTH